MKASIILSHPYSKSFNHAIFNTICSTLEEMRIQYFAHDLYKEQFNPVLTAAELGSDSSDDPLVIQYSRELILSDLLFFIHPNWWGQPPAVLKGYIDRVIRPPHAYDFPAGDTGGGLPVAKLTGKTGIVFNTSNTEELRENEYFGDPLESIWKQCVFGFCGIENYFRRTFRIVSDSTHEIRKQWLSEVEADVKKCIARKT